MRRVNYISRKMGFRIKTSGFTLIMVTVLVMFKSIMIVGNASTVYPNTTKSVLIVKGVSVDEDGCKVSLTSYDGEEISLESVSIYNFCKDKIGKEVDANFTSKYDTNLQNIVSLESEGVLVSK